MRWRAKFAPDISNVRRARALVNQALEDTGLLPSAIDDTLLVVGELASNAVRHAGTEFTASVLISDGIVRVEVFDRDTRPPALLGLDEDSTSGRGLHLVAAIATAWGWQTAEDDAGVSGKLVWAELRTDRTDRSR
jgi:anti-sigma regulatory factor (Ser/Thr protein kinase)